MNGRPTIPGDRDPSGPSRRRRTVMIATHLHRLGYGCDHRELDCVERGSPAASAEERARLMIEALEVDHIPEPVELPTWDDCADRLAAIYRNVLDARSKRPIDADFVQAAG